MKSILFTFCSVLICQSLGYSQKIDQSSTSIELFATLNFWKMGNLNNFLVENGYNPLRAIYAPIGFSFSVDNPAKRAGLKGELASTYSRNRNDDGSTASLNVVGSLTFMYHLVNQSGIRVSPMVGIGYRMAQIEARIGEIDPNFGSLGVGNFNRLSFTHQNYGLEFGVQTILWRSVGDLEKTLGNIGIGFGYFQPVINSWRAYDTRLDNSPRINAGGFFIRISAGTFLFRK